MLTGLGKVLGIQDQGDVLLDILMLFPNSLDTINKDVVAGVRDAVADTLFANLTKGRLKLITDARFTADVKSRLLEGLDITFDHRNGEINILVTEIYNVLYLLKFRAVNYHLALTKVGE